jgi:hypothetical protein
VRVIFNKEIHISQWKDFLSINPFSTPFQSPEFYELFNSVAGLSADVIAVEDSDCIRALVVITFQKEAGLKSFFSRRCIIYGGPLVDIRYPEASILLLQETFFRCRNKAIYIETRNLSDYKDFRDIFNQCDFKYVPYLNFHIKISDRNSMLQLISNSRRRQINKALKCGVTWKEAANSDEIMRFYEILAALYRNKVRKPLPPPDFFIKFFDKGPGKYLMVWYNERIIGGIMCPLSEKTIYEFYVCGLDDEYKEQSPSVLATWAAMEYASQNNIPQFDLMGAGRPEDRYGVREFKARFGGEQVEFGRFIKITNRLLYTLGKLGLLGMKILKR